jgi:hypothetical protein
MNKRGETIAQIRFTRHALLMAGSVIGGVLTGGFGFLCGWATAGGYMATDQMKDVEIHKKISTFVQTFPELQWLDNGNIYHYW